ncbi:MAG: 30S ribosomal protein S2 [Chitinophagales bacterium]|jgi:small subunit ribosomal protein S2|nr:30S ribosomal protein S2 [Chitinophagales bacterium]
MEQIQYKQLLEAGVHFGHLKKKWNPKMMPYIFMERKGIHIIDLNKTLESLQETAAAMRQIARSGKKILFVATKKQAKEIVAEAAQRAGMPYVTERWLGGMLTNFSTIRKSIKKMQGIEKMLTDGTLENITKKERLRLMRDKAKLEKVLGGIAALNRLPAAIYLVDIMHEHISLAEAKKLNIQTIGMVDTNSDPTQVDFAIPANDDATKSIAIITNYLTQALIEGLEERQKDKEALDAAQDDDESAELRREFNMGEDEEEREKRGGPKKGGKSPGSGGGKTPAGGPNRRRGPARPAQRQRTK